jgi:hypothetical protein
MLFLKDYFQQQYFASDASAISENITAAGLPEKILLVKAST